MRTLSPAANSGSKTSAPASCCCSAAIRESGTTEVSVENIVENKVIVRITDNGNGIQKVHLKRLFERFFRIENSGNRSTGGSGLGLAIVKHIIDAHNEKIYVESDYGVGSEFSFTLEKSN